ncbi:hypothetical protein AXF42_Ash001785 [Apostasia shenzhenica]|uniref:Serine aminopeptidase S33 domain-containing protein n=1 Tax=Apostasia shenzhenica TaxID=1088818 RepID=A0A2I0AB83_9ASPA|nr:hypothetical protein AXF42_Ash001785 [Apostasia shenzhenica]
MVGVLGGGSGSSNAPGAAPTMVGNDWCKGSKQPTWAEGVLAIIIWAMIPSGGEAIPRSTKARLLSKQVRCVGWLSLLDSMTAAVSGGFEGHASATVGYDSSEGFYLVGKVRQEAEFFAGTLARSTGPIVVAQEPFLLISSAFSVMHTGFMRARIQRSAAVVWSYRCQNVEVAISGFRHIIIQTSIYGNQNSFLPAGNTNAKIWRQLTNQWGHILKCSHYIPDAFPENTTLPCVIYCHGNSGCRADANEAVAILLPSNITVFTLDFSGSGLSGGDYVSLGWHEKDDLKIVVSFLRNNQQISCIGLWGRSMGAVTRRKKRLGESSSNPLPEKKWAVALSLLEGEPLAKQGLANLSPVASEQTTPPLQSEHGKVISSRLFDLKKWEDDILKTSSEVAGMMKSMKDNQDKEMGCFHKRVAELEDALLKVTKHSLASHKEGLGELYKFEERITFLARSNAEWAGKLEATRAEFNHTISKIHQAHNAYVKDLQRRIKELDQEEALAKECDHSKAQAMEAKETET